MGLYNRFCKHFFAAVIIRLTANLRAPFTSYNVGYSHKTRQTEPETHTKRAHGVLQPSASH